ncbi:MAG: DUF1802 family protein [Verrucomicrobia bacterium]|nr:DUF1802 family protein [Verrucomicrobiota bacterium]
MAVIGFKDWSVLCAAMAQGEQSIILRKGGLAEGRDGFQFKHREFFLYPTAFHEQLAKLRVPAGRDVPEAGEEQVAFFAAFRLEWSAAVTDWEAARALEPFHLYREEVVRERFDYDEAPGLQVAFGRALRVEPAWIVPYERRFGGCRSWIQLPEQAPAFSSMSPALDDTTHAQRGGQLAAWAQRFGIELRPVH